MEEKNRYVTIKEAANILDVSSATLRNWDKSGKLKATRDPQNDYRIYEINELSTILREKGVAYQVTSQSTLTGDDYKQSTLFHTTTPNIDYSDVRSLRLLVKRLSRAFRDSMGGGILERFEEISKVIWCKFFDETQTLYSSTYEKQFFITKVDSIDTGYQRIVELYEQSTQQNAQIFSNGLRHLSEDKAAIVKCAELLQNVQLLKIPSDVKGIIYEELVRNTFEKNENQQFFTPRVIVEFLVAMASPNTHMTICDPACGSGGFLIEILAFLAQQKALETQPKLIGLEIDKRMAWITQMNLLMHGGNSDNIHYLSNGGALSTSNGVGQLIELESVDLIITNPPFGSSYSVENDLENYTLGHNKSSRRRGILFIERAIQWLKPNGRLAIILDDSVLNGRSNDDVRAFILQHSVIEAVLSLPDVTFMPYATAKASILIVRKKSNFNDVQSPIFMAEIQNVGKKANGDPLYSDVRNQSGKLILQNDLPTVLQEWRVFKGGQTDSSGFIHGFVCKPTAFRIAVEQKKAIRFDVPFHHPSRESAEITLKRSPYPTPKLAELIVLRTSQVAPAKQDPNEIWNYVGLANIKAGTGEYFISQTIGSKLKSNVRHFKHGDILFSRLRPELRKCVLVEDDEGYASSECLVFRPVATAINDPDLQSKVKKQLISPIWEVDSEYLSFMLRSDLIFGQLVYQITGVGRPRISQNALLSTRIPIPPLAVQMEIVSAAKMARQHYEECQRRSELAIQEGAAAIQSAYAFATEKLCPQKPKNQNGYVVT